MGGFVLAGVILNGAWTQLDAIGWPMWFLPALTFALDAGRFRLGRGLFRRPARPEPAPILIAAAVCAIHLSHVALTAREEFGFGGDEGYHLSATRAFALYFMKAGPLLATILVLFAVCRQLVPRLAATIAMVALIAASYWLPAAPLFGRYPTAFYFLATPLNVAFDVAGVPYPFTANHIVNSVSALAWLFALRPMLFGRWPDWTVLPAALVIYFQGPSIVYVSGGLLEPWAFVFVLLAMEAAVALEPDRRFIAVLLAGIATLFKDTAILFLPPIWLLAMIEWRGRRPVLRANAIAVAAAAATPFLTYYAARRGLQIVRGYEVAGAAGVWTLARAAEWLSNARLQLGPGGSIAIAALAAWGALGALAHRRAAQHHFVWMIAAGALAVFFAADVASIPFTGYGRFLAYPLLALCGILFATTHLLSSRRRVLIAVTLSIAALQAAAVVRILALDFQPDYERNSLEWPQSLVRYPIRSLSSHLPAPASAPGITRIRVITFGVDPISLQVAYPDLALMYDLQGEMQASNAPDCSCRSDSEALLAGFEWPAHFTDTPEGHDRYQQQQHGCMVQVRATCASVVLEQRAGGAIVGALGVGTR